MAEIIKMLNDNSNDFIEMANKLSIDELEKCIEYATDKYYYTSTPIIDDNKYDILIIFPTNICLNIMIKNIYKDELIYSTNLRFIILMLFLFFRIIGQKENYS